VYDEDLLFQDGDLRISLQRHAEGINREIKAAEEHVMQVAKPPGRWPSLSATPSRRRS
jgi:hypothetical protein